VGETLRVVRVNSVTPRRASSSRMVWLNADCETPSFAAAFVKLRSRATATTDRLNFGSAPAFGALSFVRPARVLWTTSLSGVRRDNAILRLRQFAYPRAAPLNADRLAQTRSIDCTRTW
jgi:hypothetical protein